MRERPNLHALAVYVAVVEHGTMTAAAEAEGISQPAISAQVMSLERFFGTPLLDRTGRRVKPTPAGDIVTQYGRNILRLADDLSRSVESINSLESGRLVIGAGSTVGEHLLPSVLGTYHQLYPGVHLSLSIGNSGEVTQAVRDREIDIGIIGQLPVGDDLAGRPVFEDWLDVFVGPESRFADATVTRMEDLKPETFVLREQGSATRDLALECLAAGGCNPVRVMELGSNEAVKRTVMEGLGVGVLSTHALEVDIQAGRIVAVDIDGWDCPRKFRLIHLRERLLTRAEQAFLDLL